jgi:RNA polymerase sigma-70 factor (ECF subfamily)
MGISNERDAVGVQAAQFTTTHWSVVLGAQQPHSAQAFEALSSLCQTYWYPLYVYVRRQGYDPHEAQDLTQEFFARFLESNSVQSVNPAKGKFRSYLLACMNHFLAKEWNRAHRQKRGGGCAIVSLNDDSAEQRYKKEPATECTPEKMFERRWALTLLDAAMSRLESECRARGRSELFDALKAFIAGDSADETYASVAARLATTEGAIKVAVHRLRARYGALLRQELSHTVSGPELVEEEIRFLFEALAVNT